MRQHRRTYATTLSFGHDGEPSYSELEIKVSYTVLWGAPEQGPSYASGGQPADPDEIDDIRVETVDGEKRPWDRGFGFMSDKDLEDLILERLDSDEHYAAMIEAANEAEVADRDDAAEMAWEERRLEQLP